VLSSWLRLIVGALMVLIVLALVMHYLFIIGGAPIGIRWGFFNIFHRF
jgi:hypothetical protein